MDEMWCKEHQQAWFKKGKMKSFAHPILDDEGNPTGEWCNKPQESETELTHTDTKERQFKQDPAKQRSIENQKAIDCAVNLCIGSQIEVSEILKYAKDFANFIRDNT